MTSLREGWARLSSFLRKQELDREFDEELAAHIDFAADDFIRQGLSPSEARRQALISSSAALSLRRKLTAKRAASPGSTASLKTFAMRFAACAAALGSRQSQLGCWRWALE